MFACGLVGLCYIHMRLSWSVSGYQDKCYTNRIYYCQTFYVSESLNLYIWVQLDLSAREPDLKRLLLIFFITTTCNVLVMKLQRIITQLCSSPRFYGALQRVSADVQLSGCNFIVLLFLAAAGAKTRLYATHSYNTHSQRLAGEYSEAFSSQSDISFRSSWKPKRAKGE